MAGPSRRRHCRVVLPRHHTSLAGAGWWPRLLAEACRAAAAADEDDAEEGTNEASSRRHSARWCDVLIVQCHSEGAAWKGLAPPLLTWEHVDSNCCGGGRRCMCRDISTAGALIEVLTNRFREGIGRIDVALALENCREGDEDGHDGASHTTAFSSDDWFAQGHDIPCASNNNNVPFILLVLPPNPHLPNFKCYSRTPSTSPTNHFALRLLHLENNLIRLTSLSAYVSTLGGGFFLCKYLSTAVALARHQRHLALLRNDIEMALKCRINEGYCCIHAGQVEKGRKVIRRVWRDVEKLRAERGLEEEEGWHHTAEKELSELTVIRNMCMSALRFARWVREARAVEEEVAGETNGTATKASTTHDDYQRIRIVRDRRWG